MVRGQEREREDDILDAPVRDGAVELRRAFERAKPFKHVAIDGFFEPSFARRLHDEFPTVGGESSQNVFGEGAAGKKTWHSDLAAQGGAYALADAYFRSDAFLRWIGQATGIDDLVYDESNYGGGTHENFEGRDLVPHVDFNFHPVKKLHRRLNLIVYLNDRWQREWGGSLALHSDPRDPLGDVVEYEPTFNRAVVFETSERSWHGFNRLAFPDEERGRTRKSLSIYLYTRERPSDDIYAEHTTIFVPRPLPPRFVAGLTLSATDATELAALVGQRDRLIALYQGELSKREPDSEQAARLRLELAEVQKRRTVPILGYAACSGPIEGLFPDGWSARQLDVSVVAERRIVGIRARVRFPQGVSRSACVRITVHGAAVATASAAQDVVDIGGAVTVEPGAVARISISTTGTVNHQALGISEDRRDLGFLVENLTFEHAAEPIVAERYAFLGDSHAAAFEGIFFPARSLAPVDVLTRAMWEPYLTAERLFASGRFTVLATRMLYDLRLLRPRRGEVSFEMFAPLEMPTGRGEREAVEMEPRLADRPVVLSCGEPETWEVVRGLFGRYDFLPDAPLPGLEDLPSYAADFVGVEAVRDDIERRCANMLAGLLALQRAGYTKVLLLAVPPPGVRHDGMPPESARLRYKVAATFNAVYRDFCATAGVAFVDTWPLLTIGGLRNPAYDRDGVHLNAEGAIQVVRCVQAALDRAAS